MTGGVYGVNCVDHRSPRHVKLAMLMSCKHLKGRDTQKLLPSGSLINYVHTNAPDGGRESPPLKSLLLKVNAAFHSCPPQFKQQLSNQRHTNSLTVCLGLSHFTFTTQKRFNGGTLCTNITKLERHHRAIKAKKLRCLKQQLGSLVATASRVTHPRCRGL